MRGLFLYFVVGYLAFASDAPTDEANKVHTKNFEFDDKNERIFAYVPFAKDELAYGVCEGNEADKKCKVYVESDSDRRTERCLDWQTLRRPCTFVKVSLFNAGNSRTVLALQVDETKIKLISVNLKG